MQLCAFVLAVCHSHLTLCFCHGLSRCSCDSHTQTLLVSSHSFNNVVVECSGSGEKNSEQRNTCPVIIGRDQ